MSDSIYTPSYYDRVMAGGEGALWLIVRWRIIPLWARVRSDNIYRIRSVSQELPLVPVSRWPDIAPGPRGPLMALIVCWGSLRHGINNIMARMAENMPIKYSPPHILLFYRKLHTSDNCKLRWLSARAQPRLIAWSWAEQSCICI